MTEDIIDRGLFKLFAVVLQQCVKLPDLGNSGKIRLITFTLQSCIALDDALVDSMPLDCLEACFGLLSLCKQHVAATDQTREYVADYVYCHLTTLTCEQGEEVVRRNPGFAAELARLITELYDCISEETMIKLLMVLAALLDIENLEGYGGPSVREIVLHSPDFEAISAIANTSSKQLLAAFSLVHSRLYN